MGCNNNYNVLFCIMPRIDQVVSFGASCYSYRIVGLAQQDTELPGAMPGPGQCPLS
jgi:hypothetical protein